MRTAGAAIVLAILAGPAAATPTTLPANRLILDLPSGWSLHRASGTSNQDILMSTSGVNMAVGWTDSSCSAFFSLIGGEALSVSYLPSGWEARTTSGSNVACNDAGAFRVAAQWWDPPVADYNVESTWQSDVASALVALHAMRRASAKAEPGNLITLPGTGLQVQVPEALRLDTSNPDYLLDTFTLGSGDAVQVVKAGQQCADFMLQYANFQPSTEARAEGWARWTDGALDVWCSMFAETIAVSAPVNDAATLLLLDALTGELSTEPMQEIARMPGSGLEVALPNGWTASASGGRTRITGSPGAVAFRKGGGCGGEKYDPSWIPEDWTAVVNAAGDTTTFCRSSGHKARVEVASSMVVGRHRKVVAALLTSLDDGNGPKPRVPHRPLSPIPFRLSFAATGGSSGAYGGRLATGWLLYNALGIHAEVGYDSETKINYDFHLTLGVPTRRLTVYGAAGYDAIANGDAARIPGAFYFGFGGRAGVFEKVDAWAYLEAEYLWRRHDDAPVAPEILVKHEVRIRLDVFYYPGFKNGWLQGGTLEYRRAADNTLLLGFYTRL